MGSDCFSARSPRVSGNTCYEVAPVKISQAVKMNQAVSLLVKEALPAKVKLHPFRTAVDHVRHEVLKQDCLHALDYRSPLC